MDFPNRKYAESCTHGGEKHLETLLPRRKIDSAFAHDESPCLPFLGRNDLRAINAAGPHSYGFSKQKRYRILHTRGRKTPRDPPAATRKRLCFCPQPVPMPPFLGRNDLRARNAAGPHSYYGTTAITTHTRTVSHYDTDEKDRILTTGNTMAVADKINRDMNGFPKQKRYRILHTRGRKTPRDPPAATRKRLGFRPRPLPIPPFLGRNDICAINAAGPYSYYGTTAINIYAYVPF